MQYQAKAAPPQDMQELYDFYMPQHGLLFSRICRAGKPGNQEHEVLFTRPFYLTTGDHGNEDTSPSRVSTPPVSRIYISMSTRTRSFALCAASTFT